MADDNLPRNIRAMAKVLAGTSPEAELKIMKNRKADLTTVLAEIDARIEELTPKPPVTRARKRADEPSGAAEEPGDPLGR